MKMKELDLHYEKMINSIAVIWAEVMSDPKIAQDGFGNIDTHEVENLRKLYRNLKKNPYPANKQYSGWSKFLFFKNKNFKIFIGYKEAIHFYKGIYTIHVIDIKTEKEETIDLGFFEFVNCEFSFKDDLLHQCFVSLANILPLIEYEIIEQKKEELQIKEYSDHMGLLIARYRWIEGRNLVLQFLSMYNQNCKGNTLYS